MSRQTRYRYFDRFTNTFYEPRFFGREVFGFDFPKRDIVTVRCAVTNGRAVVDSNGKPTTAYQYNLSDRISCQFGIKTIEQWANADDFSYTTAGFDTGDTDWHTTLINGCFSFGAMLPGSFDAGRYVEQIQLPDSNGNTFSLAVEEGALPTNVNELVNTGTESNPPSGAVALPAHGTARISDSATYVDIPITGFATSGIVNIGQLQSTGGYIMPQQVKSSGNLRLTVPDAPGAGLYYDYSYAVVSLT